MRFVRFADRGCGAPTAAFFLGLAALHAAAAMRILARDRRIPAPLSPEMRRLRSVLLTPMGPSTVRLAREPELPPSNLPDGKDAADSGFSARKGATLRALAERFVDGRLSDEALSRMTDDEVEATLTEVPGIGLWTARGFLLVALDRPDVFLSGDLALRRSIQRAYGFDHLPTEDEVAEVSDRWRPYRSLAVSYLFASEYDGQP
jgi:hypothetical protein